MSENFVIEDAKLEQSKAKVAIAGLTGCGKTYTALTIAKELGDRTLVIDTENKSSAKYADKFKFQLISLTDYSIKNYIAALEFAKDKVFDVVIVDSLSHAWAGPGGALEQADLASAKYGGNKGAGWRDVTPFQNRLIHTILTFPTHLIATFRMKMDYAFITDEKGGLKPKKLGLGIIQRDQFEYEFDIIAEMDIDHNLVITKTRCTKLDGYMVNKPDGLLGQEIKSWLETGSEAKVWPDGWYPTRDEFFRRVKEQWQDWDIKDIISVLKPEFGEFQTVKAADMWKALEAAVKSEESRQESQE